MNSFFQEQRNEEAEPAVRSDKMKMYIGNLSYNTTSQDLESLFSEHGEVTDVHLPIDRETGRPRGFGFVTMDSKNAMVSAIKAIDGKEIDGRQVRVNEARPKEDRGGRF